MIKKLILGIIAINVIIVVIWNFFPKGDPFLATDGVFELGEDVDFSDSAKIVFDNGTSETIIINFTDDRKIEVAAGTWQLLRTNAGSFGFTSTTVTGDTIDVLTFNLNSSEYYVYNPRLKWKHFLKSVTYGVGLTFERADNPGYELTANQNFFVVKNQYHTQSVDYFFVDAPETIETYNGINQTIHILKHFPGDEPESEKIAVITEKKVEKGIEMSAIAYFVQGQEAFEKQEYAKSRVLMWALIEKYGEDAWADDAMYYIADSYKREKNFSDSSRYFQELLNIYEASPLTDRALFGVAYSVERLKQCAQARNYFGRLIADFPSSPLYEQAKARDLAIKSFSHDADKCVDAPKEFIRNRTPSTASELESQSEKLAEEPVEEKEQTIAEEHYLEGLRQFQNGQIKKALDIWNLLIERYPNHADTLKGIKIAEGMLENRKTEKEANETKSNHASDLEREKSERLAGRMIAIPAGSYLMGNDNGIIDRPQRRVVFKAFKMGETEVTQEQWRAVMGNNPSIFKGTNRPVENISWDDIQIYIEKLNKMTGQHFRLPSESEWEYACRSGGEDETYCGGEDESSLAWTLSNSGGETHPVKQKNPNGLGLYDMSGNVSEWAQDCAKIDYEGAPIDGSAWLGGDCSIRIIRGGSWEEASHAQKSITRFFFGTDWPSETWGFRLALD